MTEPTITIRCPIAALAAPSLRAILGAWLWAQPAGDTAVNLMIETSSGTRRLRVRRRIDADAALPEEAEDIIAEHYAWAQAEAM